MFKVESTTALDRTRCEQRNIKTETDALLKDHEFKASLDNIVTLPGNLNEEGERGVCEEKKEGGDKEEDKKVESGEQKRWGKSPILQFSKVTKGGKTMANVVETSIKTKNE